jgi:hypothetical protein
MIISLIVEIVMKISGFVLYVINIGQGNYMCGNLIFRMLLGHLVGDYFLQNNWMAMNKSKHKGLGWFTCFIHCIIYTIAVCTFMLNFSPVWILIVFLSHFIIDKFGIPDKYLKLIKGRSLEVFLQEEENKIYTPHIGLRAGFNTFVYIMVDNGMHIILMYFGYLIFMGR